MAVLAAAYVTMVATKAPAHHGAHQVAFVNFQVVMKNSEAGKALNAYATPRQQALQNAAQSKLDEFKQSQQDLEKHRSSLSPDEFNARSRALQQNIDYFNAEQQKRLAAINGVADTAMQRLQATLRDQIAAIAQENDVEAVLSTDQAFYAEPKLDLTSEAIRRLDQKLGQADLHLPEDN
ncbi:MAG: OmpH family outer membrane protein [Pseudomonadota bacterium]|nr:OmpH family outer membrane protein [Pseudomonadota bacterium]